MPQASRRGPEWPATIILAGREARIVVAAQAHSLWHFPGIARDRSDRSLNLKLGNYVCSDALMSRLRARTRDQSGNAHDRFKHASQRLGRRGHL